MCWILIVYNLLLTADDKASSKRIAKQLFTPVPSSLEPYTQDVESVTADLAALLQPELPSSCFVQLYTAKPFPKTVPPNLPKTVAEVFTNQSLEISFDSKLAALLASDEEITALSAATVDQGESDVWHDHRAGRITASKCNAVYTHAHTLSKKTGATCSQRLLADVLGRGKFVQTQAMKHGIAMESRAAKQYETLMKSKHTKFRTRKSGLILSSTHPYLAASPDICVNCQCHGSGLCEIKCPYSTRHLPPSYSHLRYLEDSNGQSRLSQKSAYYFQVQAQMAVTGVQYCDFFVFTLNGYHLERIGFDGKFWERVQEQCFTFWRDYVVPAVEHSATTDPHSEEVTHTDSDTDSAGSELSEMEEASNMDHAYCAPSAKKPRMCPLQQPPYPDVCVCVVCHQLCSASDQHFSVDSIQCCDCQLWFHHSCVGVSEPDDTWICDECLCD